MLNQEKWAPDGFSVVPALISPDQYNEVLDFLARLSAARLPSIFPPGSHPDDDSWHKQFAKLREEDPNAFVEIYNAVQHSSALWRLMLRPEIVNTAAELLGLQSEDLVVTGAMLRMDAPEDTRNRLDWHQEQAYYPYHKDANDGLVVWLPLQEATKQNGTISLCPGSHSGGYLEPVTTAGDKLRSFQYTVPAAAASQYEQLQVEVAAGTAVYFNMHLFHASGINRSNRFRFSAGIRIHNPLRFQWLGST